MSLKRIWRIRGVWGAKGITGIRSISVVFSYHFPLFPRLSFASGAHTFGQAHCPSFADQVQSNRKMPAAYRKNLLSFCAGRISKMPGMPDAGGMPDHEGMTPMAFMDPATPTEFDTKVRTFYASLKVMCQVMS